jgi:hypothetical protein
MPFVYLTVSFTMFANGVSLYFVLETLIVKVLITWRLKWLFIQLIIMLPNQGEEGISRTALNWQREKKTWICRYCGIFQNSWSARQHYNIHKSICMHKIASLWTKNVLWNTRFLVTIKLQQQNCKMNYLFKRSFKDTLRNISTDTGEAQKYYREKL